MNSVICPRCRQTWLSEEFVTGSDRLCSGCVADLQAAGGDRAVRAYGSRLSRKNRQPLVLDFFLIYVVVIVVLSVVLIGLSFLAPTLFGPVLLIYGLVLFLPGFATFRVLTWGMWWGRGFDIDWHVAKWAAVPAAAGLACLMASGRMLL